MTIDLLFLAMIAVAVLAVLWPLARRRGAARGEAVAVYRDQLAEIERDRERGVIFDNEAQAAHVEVARRLIAASESAPEIAVSEPGAARTRRRVVAVFALAMVPLLALGLYSILGRPGLPDQPLASRMQQGNDALALAQLVSRVEAELAKRPEDGRGWDVVAPAYLRLGRPDEAARAFANAIRILGSTAEREAGYGEALTLAAGGVVTAEAKAAFDRALALEQGLPRARFYLGRHAEQQGDRAKAAGIYRTLLQKAPADAPWRPAARRALTQAALGEEGEMPAVDPATLAEASPGERLATIRGMVEKLEGRLKEAPNDLGGQLRLIRAWTLLGDADKARVAAGDARLAFESDAEALRRISDLMLGLGLEDGST